MIYNHKNNIKYNAIHIIQKTSIISFTFISKIKLHYLLYFIKAYISYFFEHL